MVYLCYLSYRSAEVRSLQRCADGAETPAGATVCHELTVYVKRRFAECADLGCQRAAPKDRVQVGKTLTTVVKLAAGNKGALGAAHTAL